MIDFAKIVGFDWDEGNQRKSLSRHGVTQKEAEEAFLDEFVLFLKDVKHSEDEDRFQAIGRTFDGRHLQVSFTLRRSGTLIRVISSRDMNKKEHACYD